MRIIHFEPSVDASGDACDNYVFVRASDLLASGAGTSGCVWRHARDALSWDIRDPKESERSQWDRVAVYVVGPPPEDSVVDGIPPGSCAPWYYVEPHRITRYQPCAKDKKQSERFTVYSGPVCPALCRKLKGVVLSKARDLMVRTHREGRELAGVIVRSVRTQTIQLREYTGNTADLTSVEPFCGGRRAGSSKEVNGQEEEVLAEFHTHPMLAAQGLDIAPPSAQDLYQLALACAKGEHNCSYVVAPEGLYACRILPGMSDAIVENLRSYLRLNKYSDRRIQGVISGCEQPRLSIAKSYKAKIPHLWKILNEPAESFHRLTRTPTPSAKRMERIRTFCQEMAAMGLDIEFTPRLGHY